MTRYEIGTGSSHGGVNLGSLLVNKVTIRLSRCTFASVNNLFPDANTLMVLALESFCDGLVTKCAVHIFSSKSIMQAHSGEDQRNFS